MTEKLIAQGILRPSGEVCQDKINLLSGAYVPPFVEMLWTVTGEDKDTAERVYGLLNGLYSSGHEEDMLEALRVLYGVLGLIFPETVELLASHPAARSYFLFSFLLDYDDVVQDYTA